MKKAIQIIILGVFMTISTQSSASGSCPDLHKEAFQTLSGTLINFCDFQDKVILAVNTASQCGFTGQYKDLEALHQKYKDKGLVIVGFPANNFGAQEPGSNDDIKSFCERNYGVSFTMIEKTNVRGAEANPFYKKLKSKTGEEPQWNFHKYLIGKKGQVVKSFPSGVNPSSDEFQKEIEKLL